ncbi:L-lactate dehydrogenase [Pacificibacter sp.]|uniref:L-lactate dehydrogenase n=1 Tax=Pacificibacter sp. TaxID=1917866 RepID=UPI00321ADF4E
MKIGIIGAGMVGSAAGYAIALKSTASDIVFVDQNADLARAQAQDIAHAVPFSSAARVTAGGYSDLSDADVIILAAGVSQKPGESRLDLLSRNAAVFRSILSDLGPLGPDTILLIASNPVDIMTQIATDLSGLPASRVIGSGTILDTARFRHLLGLHLGIAAHSVHAYVLGEHGDSEVLAWSSARVGALPLADFAAQRRVPITDDIKRQIDTGVRGAANTIINGKGATWYGIGAGLERIVRAIASDEQAVISMSCVTSHIEGIDTVALSIPRVVGAGGVGADVFPELSPKEHKDLAASARSLKDTFEALTL